MASMARRAGPPLLSGVTSLPGLAWQYQWNKDTVIRAAYGIFFAPPSTAAGQSLGVIGFAATTSMVTSLNGGITPYNTLDNPYPQGYQPITGSSLGLNTALGSSITAQLYGIRNPIFRTGMLASSG